MLLLTQPHRFSPSAALFLATASKWAYREEQDIAEHYLNRGDVTFVNVQSLTLDVQAFILKTPTFTALSFRGTTPTSLRDWRYNFKLGKRKFGIGKAHAGFVAEWSACKSHVMQNVYRDKPLLLTGHSKGAALATLAAYDLKCLGFKILNCYTYGSPRVGDRLWAETYDKLRVPTFRCTHSNDPVPRTPSFIRFRHVGTRVYVKDTGGTIVRPSWWELFYHKVTSFHFDAIRDHDIKEYERDLALCR